MSVAINFLTGHFLIVSVFLEGSNYSRMRRLRPRLLVKKLQSECRDVSVCDVGLGTLTGRRVRGKLPVQKLDPFVTIIVKHYFSNGSC